MNRGFGNPFQNPTGSVTKGPLATISNPKCLQVSWKQMGSWIE